MRAKTTLTLTLLICCLLTFGQQAPNSFLGLKLGTTKTAFLENNPDATEGEFWVVHTDISAKGMDVLTIKRKTSSGDEVQIDCCFKNDKLSIISVEYKGYQMESDILSGLKSKYGNYSKRLVKNYTDFMNGQDRTTYITSWTTNPTYVLEYDHTKQIGLAELIFADKATQSQLKQQKEKQNQRKVE